MVLMCVKKLHARDMEAYLVETVVARVCIGRQGDPRPQIWDHSKWEKEEATNGTYGK